MIKKLNEVELSNVSAGRIIIVRDEYDIPNFSPIGGMLAGGTLAAMGGIIFGLSAVAYHLSKKK